MRIDSEKPLQILIIKTSSLGDIIQALYVLDYLHAKFSNVAIDWVIENSFQMIVASHPLIRSAIPIETKGLKKEFKAWGRFFKNIQRLRKKTYDVVFDLQGNCKSGLITLLCKGLNKVGFSYASVREWPNLLSTQYRFNIAKSLNIRLQYVELIQQYFKDRRPVCIEGVRFKISLDEQEKLKAILRSKRLSSQTKIMVCPGSKWMNKQLSLEVLVELMGLIQQKLGASYLLVWGDLSEKEFCHLIQQNFRKSCIVIEKLSIPTWQNLMNEMDLVMAVDSSALHLCGTTKAPSFSLFGPTSPDVFKPIGKRHFAIQGTCPYGKIFEKSCPILRTCATGACIRNLSAKKIFNSFSFWWDSLQEDPEGTVEMRSVL